jgi:hypothetical protein
VHCKTGKRVPLDRFLTYNVEEYRNLIVEKVSLLNAQKLGCVPHGDGHDHTTDLGRNKLLL